MYFNPLCIIIDVFQLLFYRPVGFGMWFGVMFLGILTKVAGTYFAYLMSNSSGGKLQRVRYEQLICVRV